MRIGGRPIDAGSALDWVVGGGFRASRRGRLAARKALVR
jgi:hypothetical protein